MTPGDLSPGFIKVLSHSAFGPHVTILPVNTPVINEGTPASSTITNWASGTVSWRTMVTDLITLIADAMPDSYEYDTAILYTKELGEDPIPWDQFSLAIPGTVVTAGWAKATQETISVRDADFNLAKLVLLDFASGGDFAKYTDATAAGVDLILAEWTDPTNGWSSQKNARPNIFISATRTLNEKLRRAYRLT
jgi:hypothetical protein